MSSLFFYILFSVSFALSHNSPTYKEEISHGIIQRQHSLNFPTSNFFTYWSIGGSTTLTNSEVRLTPARGSKKGFLWNKQPLTSIDNWEITFRVKVSSDVHLGGDGFAIWFLESGMLSTGDQIQIPPDFFIGNIFGMRNDFKGFAVIFDTWDNDDKHDNPGIFAIQNFTGKIFPDDHDKDFKPSWIGDGLIGLETSCVANYRTRNKQARDPFLIHIALIDRILYVYINPDNAGMKFCLAAKVHFDKKKQYHLAMTAITGQLADTHYVYDITTRFLNENLPPSYIPQSLEHIKEAASYSNQRLYLFILFICSSILLIHNAYEILLFYRFSCDKISAKILCTKINIFVNKATYLSLVLFILSICFRYWVFVIMSFPTFAWYMTMMLLKQSLLNPEEFMQQAEEDTLDKPTSSIFEGTLATSHWRLALSRYATVIIFLIQFIYIFIKLVTE